MGPKNNNITHRSRILDNFLAKFKKVVNCVKRPDKTPLEPPMTSLVNPAAILSPPTALPHSAPVRYRPLHPNHNGGSNYYASDCRRSSEADSVSSGQSGSSMTRSEESGGGGGGSSGGDGSDGPDEDYSTPEAQNRYWSEKRQAKDFRFGKIIGEGSFSVVYLAKDIKTKRELAIKVCTKELIIKERKVEQIRREREILTLLSSCQSETAPFFVKIFSSFQDPKHLFFVLTYATNGELFSHINKVGSFDHACTKFYAAEILHALEHMHGLGIVHRDLKPENILLDENMHIQITDFGSAKILTETDRTDSADTARRRSSFVGTAQYISPELLSDHGGECSRASDLWAFGAIIYQMISGLPPFRATSEWVIFKKIKLLDYEYPEGFDQDAEDLITRLLVIDPRLRLGAKDGKTYTSIRAHPFFDGVVFESLYKQTPPAIYPYLPGSSDYDEELRSRYRVPDHIEPGLDDRQITRLLGLELSGILPPRRPNPEPAEKRQRSLLGLSSLTKTEEARRLTRQKENDPAWHRLCQENLILKKGIVQKRKGLFSRKRMLMLTMGPHLYYADPENYMLKGEIPWSPELRVEPKNFKIFFVHTPDRTYYLQDPEGYALEWCAAIEEMRVHLYDKET